MIESHPIPKIAKTAFGLAKQNFDRAVNELARQSVEAAGFNPDDNWTVDFDRGMMAREVPDIGPPA